MNKLVCHVLLCLLGLFVTVATAAPPKTLSYQGVLTNASAAPVNAPQSMVFSLYDVASGGTALWTETQASVTVSNGLFSVTLGSVTPITLPFNAPYYLGVKVGTDAEMSPRQPLAASAYAMRALQVDAAGPALNTTYVGIGAGNFASLSTGFDNSAFGTGALGAVTSGSLNTAIGSNALAANTGGGGNTAVGSYAQDRSTSGSGNTAVGDRSMRNNASGVSNTAMGQFALLILGNSDFGTVVSADQNTVIGTSAAENLFSGSKNIGLGYQAGFNWTSGSNNIAIGHAGVAGESGIIRLGTSGTHTQTILSGTVFAPNLDVSNEVIATRVTGSTVVAPKIGANLPAAAIDRPLTIQVDTASGGSEWISFKNATAQTKWHVNHKNGGVNFAETGVADARLFLAAGGKVGIGTDGPTKATLEVNGSVSTTFPSNWGLFSSGLSQSTTGGNFGGVSIYASHLIAGQAFIAYSDQRMKRIGGRSNTALDLDTLNGIEITDYTHIDTANRGDSTHKKVIAQQVEKVYPQAVGRMTDVVPDIYQRAAITDGWIALSTNLNRGDRVRLIGNASHGVHEVLDVSALGFRTAFKGDAPTVFVYGREVNDFRTVDYEAIAMLNVSATQELHRRVEAQAAELATLKQELAAIKTLLNRR